ncbi:DUF917 family protein [Photobacterium nomapromontoriensis]|uniref:S-methyl thiohydantoin desulfurase domain-containing protein n=1 Tax=Photobacterium nomapromontoriensis TaxID=2910237 RepID=UPI003D0D1CBC
MKQFEVEDLRDILVGSHFYASGGGGALENGTKLLEVTLEALQRLGKSTIAYLDVGDETLSAASFYAPFVGAVGSPDKYLEAGFIYSPEWAYDLHQQTMRMSPQLQSDHFSYQHQSERIDFQSVIPIETGTITYGMAMLIAAQKNIPIMNMDGCGRAVPVLGMVGPAQPVSGAPRLAPVALVSETPVSDGGAQLIINTADLDNLNDMMHGIISEDKGFDARSAMSCFALSGQNINAQQPGYFVPGSLERARRLGAALRNPPRGRSKVDVVLEHTGGIEMVTGIVIDVHTENQNGFDFLKVTMVDANNRTYVTHAENETLLLSVVEPNGTERPLVMGPDLICFLTSEGDTISNAELSQQKKSHESAGKPLIIHVFALPAANGMNSPHLQSLYLQELKKFGFEGHYISPFEETCIERAL